MKLLSDHSIDKYKSRVVAKRYHQKQGINYIKTFTTVVKPQIIRIVLTIVISFDWYISQLDVNNAFLD